MAVAVTDSRTKLCGELCEEVSPAMTIALLAGITAAWFASGATGLIGRPLQMGLVWCALAVALIATWPRKTSFAAGIVLTSAIFVALLLTASAMPAVHVLAVAIVLAAIGQASKGLPARIALIAALSVTVLGCFRFACTSIPTVWLLADAVGCWLGRLASWLVGARLEVGATFAGLDFLVLTAAFYVAWLFCTTPPQRSRAIWAAVAIATAHIGYLALLAYSEKLLATLPDRVLTPVTETSHLGIWTIGNGLRTLIPWNLPLVALAIHCGIVAVMARSTPWLPIVELSPLELERQKEKEKKEEVPGAVLATDMLFRFGPTLLAIVAALSGALALNRGNLQDKTVVAYEKGYVNWLKPEYDAQVEGFYGMLPMFVESLGGKFVRSNELSAEELASADVLVMIHPDQPWPKDVLERVWDYVRRGGSLLIVAEPAMQEQGSKSSFNELLAPLAMQVRFDTAVTRMAGWEQAYNPLVHQATAGIDDMRNRFGLQLGSSIRARWPAKPVLTGRWGWSDPGNDAANTGGSTYNGGELLGDLVLAAEQAYGNGRVFVLGDTSPLRNEMLASSYPFAGRLLSYLAYKPTSPQTLWRQLLTLLSVVAMIGLLAARPAAWQLMLTPGVLAISLVCCTAAGYWSGHLLPDGRPKKPDQLNELAYVDASHLEAYSSDLAADHGVKDLLQTLMRHGFLPLMAPDLNKERLERAAVVISIGPAREFTSAERQTIKAFVDSGGTFILMAGAGESRPSELLLADFGLKVPSSPVRPGDDAREPEPRGPLPAPFDSPKRCYRYYAAWPVESLDGAAKKVVSPSEQSTWAYVYRRAEGQGSLVVIGDTHFGCNENFALGGRLSQNQVMFWRWLLSQVVAGEEPWSPTPGVGDSSDEETMDAMSEGGVQETNKSGK